MIQSSEKYAEVSEREDGWGQIHVSSYLGDVESVKSLIRQHGCEINCQSMDRAIPNLTALQVAIASNSVAAVSELLSHPRIDSNIGDQWGLVPLHYAVYAHNPEIVSLLLSHGAVTNKQSKNGTTPLELAETLKYADIVDLLHSRVLTENDPSTPKFRDWLRHLGASEYFDRFLAAGYDLPFLAKNPITDEDLDCVDIPKEKRGLRRKIMEKHDLEKYYSHDVGSDGDDDEDENDDSDDD